MKRILAIHDLSCYGKCSLTTVLPVLSAAGYEVVPLPTAVLSAHTGFDNFTIRDLTDFILPSAEHLNRLGVRFDAIYTGYLANINQIELVSQTLELLADADTFIYVDPVMGDDGAFYKGFDGRFAAAMKTLCQKADLTTPNFTEAAFLGLTEQCLSRQTVVTGIETENQPDQIFMSVTDSPTSDVKTVGTERVDGRFHGTGDLFGSVLLGRLLKGAPLFEAAEFSAGFVKDSIKDALDGILGFEKHLYKLH